MSAEERIALVKDILSSADRQRFLSELLFGVSIAARGESVEAGCSETHAAHVLHWVNELQIVIASQIRSLTEEKPAYPDGAFLQVLTEKANIGDCQHVLAAGLVHGVTAVSRARPV